MIIIEIDIELYKIFYIVAKVKNITKASQILYTSQPAVTMSIKKLEEQLGVTLFVRTKRGVILTDEGNLLNDYITKAMENITLAENKISSIKKLESGNIKIGIGASLTKHFLVKYLEKFHKLYPKVGITIDTSISAEVLKKLEDGYLDMAIVISDKTTYKNLKVEYSEPLHYIFVGNKEYKERITKDLTMEELNSYPLLLQNINSNPRNFLDKFTQKEGIILNSFMDLSSYSLVIDFAKIGMGIGFIAKEYIKKELENKELFEITTNPKVPVTNIVVVTRNGYIPSFTAKKLIDLIKNYNK